MGDLNKQEFFYDIDSSDDSKLEMTMDETKPFGECLEVSEYNSFASAVHLRLDTPGARNKVDDKRVSDRDFGISKSNQRRYSSVVAEYLRKRDSIVPDPTSINPSTILTLQADQAGPEGFSYVSFPSNTSDESFDRAVNFSPNPSRTEEDTKIHPLCDRFSRNGSLSEIVPIRTSISSSKCQDERKFVTFLFTPTNEQNPSFYEAPKDLDCERVREHNYSTSTPLDCLHPKNLSFNDVSERLSVSRTEASPQSLAERKITSPGKTFAIMKKITTPKSPLRHRGSYSLPQSPECMESKNGINVRRRNLGLIFIIVGIIMHIISFIILFVVVPYVESSEESTP